MLKEIKQNGYQTGELQVLARPTGATSLAGAKVILALHGRDGNACQPFTPFVGWHRLCRRLVSQGIWIFGVDYGAQSRGAGTTDANSFENPWWEDRAMTAMAAARSHLVSNYAINPKVGIFEYSLGGGTGFNFGFRNPTLVAGIIAVAPACDGDYFYNNTPGCAAEMERAFATLKTTTTGSGTLNQVGSNLTIASALSVPAAGVGVLYPFTDLNGYINPQIRPVLVTRTGGGGTATWTGCTIAAGSQPWGTGTTFIGVGESGGWAANKATRSPILIAADPSFDTWPLHAYVGTLDASVGANATPPSTQVPDFCAAVGVNAVYHSIAGANHSTIWDMIDQNEIAAIVGTFKW